MDKASFIGVIGAFLVVGFGIILGGGSVLAYIDAASIVIVFVGTIMSTIGANSMQNVRNMGKIIKIIFKNSIADPVEHVSSLISFSEKARREGILSLEDEVDNIDDEFLKLGMRLVIDGSEPNAVKAIMNAELTSLDTRHSMGIKMVEDMAGFAPAFGMIGTLIGLVVMMRSLGGDPSAIGKGMAAALITTLYGSVLANCFFLPAAGKLDKLNAQEIMIKELIIEGILSLQAGDNPKILQTKLTSYFTPEQRKQYEIQKDNSVD